MAPDDGNAVAAQVLTDAASAGNVNLGTDAKSKKLLHPDRARGWLFVDRLLRSLGDAGCVTFLVLAEKRYVIAAKIVETFLDPVDNPSAPEAFNEDVEARQDAASSLTALPDAVLFQFARAFRQRDHVELAASLEAIINHLAQANAAGLRSAFEAMRGQEQSLTEELATLDVDGPGNKSLNLPVFVDMVTNLELFARGTGATNVRVIHDETREFAPALETAYKSLRDANGGMLRLSNGNIMVTGYQALQVLEFGDSSAASGIQIADLLAGAARIVTTRALNRQSMCDEAANVGAGLVGLALMPRPKVASLIISSPFAEQVVGPLIRRLALRTPKRTTTGR